MEIQVKLWGDVVGVLYFNKKDIYFKYEESFIEKGIEISPLLMPTKGKEEIYNFAVSSKSDTFQGLPPVFSDSLPDNFGIELLNKIFLAKKLITQSYRYLSPLEKLSLIGDRGIGALEYFPKNEEFNNSSIIDLSKILEDYQKLIAEEAQKEKNFFSNSLKSGCVAGGAKPKFVIAIDNNTGKIFSGDFLLNHKDVSYYILKIQDKTLNSDYCKIEYAYYEMAKLSGIDMMPTKLYENNGKFHFLTERFDRKDGEKLHTQTLNSLTGWDFRDIYSEHSYEGCFETMQKLNLSQDEIEQQYRRMVFNVVARNCDDHTKNISFIMDRNGKWSLSPAYDMMYCYNKNSGLEMPREMSINGKYRDIINDDVYIVGEKFNIGHTREIISEVCSGVSNWVRIAKELGIESENIKELESNLLYNSIKRT